MPAWLTVVLVLALPFWYVLFKGAPYLPTLGKQRETGLDLLGLKPGQHLVDLGSGDGTILLAAALRGIKATGYELNPLLWLVSKIRLWPHRRLVKVKLADYWKQPLPTCDGVFVFLIQHRMVALGEKLEREITKPLKLASYTFTLPNHKPKLQRDGVFLYEIAPAKTARVE